MYFEFDKDENGGHVAKIYAEFYERVESAKDHLNVKEVKEKHDQEN